MTTTRPTLADLNAKNRKTGIKRGDYTLTYELRIGRWGVAWTHVGRSRGLGGTNLHVMRVNIIEALPADFDAKANCLKNGPEYMRKYADSKLPWESELAHGGAKHTTCYATKVGDVFDTWPICRDNNVGHRGAFEPAEVDTEAVTCIDCLRGFFHESTPGRPQMDAERKATLALLPPTIHCALCDREQKRQFIKDGLCSTCSSLLSHDIAWNEKTGREYRERHASENHEQREANYRAANPGASHYSDHCIAEAERYEAHAAKSSAKRDRLAIKGAKSRTARGAAS